MAARSEELVAGSSRSLGHLLGVEAPPPSSGASISACSFSRLSVSRRAASCRRCIGDAESVGGLAVEITALLEPLFPLELGESLSRLWAHHAVRLTNIEALLIELHL